MPCWYVVKPNKTWQSFSVGSYFDRFTSSPVYGVIVLAFCTTALLKRSRSLSEEHSNIFISTYYTLVTLLLKSHDAFLQVTIQTMTEWVDRSMTGTLTDIQQRTPETNGSASETKWRPWVIPFSREVSRSCWIGWEFNQCWTCSVTVMVWNGIHKYILIFVDLLIYRCSADEVRHLQFTSTHF